ncbi:hypothetical protein AVEN_86146-1 [Araneus ventricosus]|uniref:Uncharacterized protein n=1 Tax=Araneus ventricosus TaxID=182803 RepID=A0A4Y2L0V2_ARAVE|nr:hypothetical protein AVEN_86146-1 [Araneus ventricosus]
MPAQKPSSSSDYGFTLMIRESPKTSLQANYGSRPSIHMKCLPPFVKCTMCLAQHGQIWLLCQKTQPTNLSLSVIDFTPTAHTFFVRVARSESSGE